MLEDAGAAILYGTAEEESLVFYIQIREGCKPPVFSWIKENTPCPISSIDWKQQWAMHGHQFHEGCVHIPFEGDPFSDQSLRLAPGPGFGDFSHPTTHLMLNLLKNKLKGHNVIDIGCGSGVLTLAALLLGASSAYGIDIEPAIIEHAKGNIALNTFEGNCEFLLFSEFSWRQNTACHYFDEHDSIRAN